MRLQLAARRYIAAAPQLSGASARRITHNLNRWARYGGSPESRQITTASLESFRLAALADDLSPASIETTIADVRTLCRFAGRIVPIGRRLRLNCPNPDVPTVSRVGAIYRYADAALWPRVASSRGGRRSEWLECSTGDWWRAWIVCASWFGFRLSNIRLLTWEVVADGRLRASKTGKHHPVIVPDFVDRHISRLSQSRSGPIFAKNTGGKVRRELQRIAAAAGVSYASPQQFRQFCVQQWSLANPDAGRIVHGTGLGILDHYVSGRRIVEAAAESVEMPPEFFTAAERAARESGERELLYMYRHTLPDDQKYVAMPPARPCRANIWKVNLRRYADSSESCACFERDIVLQGTRRTGWPEKVGQ